MTYRVTHRTTYEYDEPVSTSYHALRLTPRSLPYQKCHWSKLTMDPSPAFSNDSSDYFGNAVVLFTLQESVDVIPVEES